MPRNGSGTYSTPNSFSAQTTIESAKVNANFSDIGSEITNSLPRDGQASMTGQFKAANGTASAPGITFGSDTDTGFYRSGVNALGISAGGINVGTLDANGYTDPAGVVVSGIPTGAVMMFGATSAPTGWVRCNSKPIGSASSGATERANADCENLFTFLWTNYSNANCPVSDGRGASAAADWSANKTIATPDWRGRSPFGNDTMGASAAGRLGSVLTPASTNGSTGGTETVTLTTSQMPQHSHSSGSLVTGSVSDHTHSVSGSPDGIAVSVGGESFLRASSSNTGASGAHSHSISGITENAGSSLSHSNMPPAFITTFIMKL